VPWDTRDPAFSLEHFQRRSEDPGKDIHRYDEGIDFHYYYSAIWGAGLSSICVTTLGVTIDIAMDGCVWFPPHSYTAVIFWILRRVFFGVLGIVILGAALGLSEFTNRPFGLQGG
jgi:hypothetical protein